MKKLGVIAIVLCMILGVFAGCANNGGQTTDPTTGPNSGGTTAPQSTAPVSTEPAKAEPYGIFRNYITGEIETLNAHMWSSSNAGTMISMTTMVLYQQLPSEDRKSFYLSGEFAESEPKQVDAEGLKWEIKLRENCVWDNGDKMDVNDVIYSFKMCLDPLLVNSRASQLASDYITIKNATPYYLQGSDNTVAWEDVGIYAVSDYVLGIELDAPVTAADIMSHFNYSWTCMVHEPTYEAGMSSDRTTTTYGSTVEKFMSCGRFIVTDWINGSVMNFKRNDNYFNDSIMLEGYQYKMLADSNTALELFLNDELDVVSLNASVIEQYLDDPRVRMSPSSSITTITINHGNTNNNGILGNVNFRKALYHAMDRAAIAKMTNGIAADYLVASKCLGDQSKGQSFREMPMAQEYLYPNLGYDTALAKSYYDTALAEAGLTSLTLTLSYSETSTNYKAISEFLQKELPKIFGDSFTLNLLAASSSVLTEQVKGWKNGDPNSYELTFRGWNTSTPAPWNGLKVYNSTYSNKNEPYFNSDYDELWEKANNTLEAKLDPLYRLQLTCQMEKMAIEDVVACPLYEAPGYSMVSDRVNLITENYIPGYGYGYNLCTIEKP